MTFNVISLMPEMIKKSLEFGVVGSAFKKQICELNLINPRDFTTDTHQTVDDRPYGGGDGMLMLAEPLHRALLKCGQNSVGSTYYLSPQGKPLTDHKVKSLAKKNQMTLICGRYAGVDQRFLDHHKIEEISIGDYVLSGGELAALVIIDSVCRQIPGVLGHWLSAENDSFSDGLLESPHYTRPQVWQESEVPPVLLSGNHEKIGEFKKWMGLLTTLIKRPDLLQGISHNWTGLYEYFEKLEPKELTFFGLQRTSLLKTISEKINE